MQDFCPKHLTSSSESGKIPITERERLLLLLCLKVEFGRLIDVDLPDGNKSLWDLSPFQRKLIVAIREGNNHFDEIKVHDGQPVSALVKGEEHGFKFVKTFRFS